MAAAEAALDDAKRTYRRIKRLVARQTASLHQLDDTRAAENADSARLNAAKALLDLALAGVRQHAWWYARGSTRTWSAAGLSCRASWVC